MKTLSWRELVIAWLDRIEEKALKKPLTAINCKKLGVLFQIKRFLRKERFICKIQEALQGGYKRTGADRQAIDTSLCPVGSVISELLLVLDAQTPQAIRNELGRIPELAFSLGICSLPRVEKPLSSRRLVQILSQQASFFALTAQLAASVLLKEDFPEESLPEYLPNYTHKLSCSQCITEQVIGQTKKSVTRKGGRDEH
jgi:hypothetical protein